MNWASLPAEVREILENGVGAENSHTRHPSLLPSPFRAKLRGLQLASRWREHAESAIARPCLAMARRHVPGVAVAIGDADHRMSQ